MHFIDKNMKKVLFTALILLFLLGIFVFFNQPFTVRQGAMRMAPLYCQIIVAMPLLRLFKASYRHGFGLDNPCKKSLVNSWLGFFGVLFREKNIRQISPPKYQKHVDLNLNYFATPLGKKDIEEINKNVFEKFGYTLIKNDLIPVLKKTLPSTCDNVFLERQNIAKSSLTVNPLKELPNPSELLLKNYSRSWQWYFNDYIPNNNDSVRTEALIDSHLEIVKFNSSDLRRPYGDESLSIYEATKHFNISGQEGAVIGSQAPWAEVYCLANGAKHITTLDYRKYVITNPKMDFLYALDLPSLSKKYYNKFDFIVSSSSIESSGLGRYGDPTDPIGDLREMNKIRCLLKPKGLLFLDLPVGVDTVVYNAHRLYGRIRLALMFEGFRLVATYYSKNMVSEQHIFQVLNDETQTSHYLFVLEKMDF